MEATLTKKANAKQYDSIAECDESDRMQFLYRLLQFKETIVFKLCRKQFQNKELSGLYDLLLLLIVKEIEYMSNN